MTRCQKIEVNLNSTQPSTAIVIMGKLIDAFPIMQIASYFVIAHWGAFGHAAFAKTEKSVADACVHPARYTHSRSLSCVCPCARFFDACGVGSIGVVAVVTLLQGGMLYPRQVIQPISQQPLEQRQVAHSTCPHTLSHSLC